MDYIEALEYVHTIPRFVRPLGNEKLGGLLNLLGNPHKKLRYVHVAGTNGKGSVCAFTAEILKNSGYKTGLFTSPFIEVFNERIRINGEMIEDGVLARYITEISNVMEENDLGVSEFAFITAVAFKYFADEGCDIVVLETGMGGRLDATNIIPAPLCAVLTSVSLDHTQFLGETVEEIANEKCGIIKDGCSVVSAPNDAVRHIITKAAPNAVICDKCEYDGEWLTYKGKCYNIGRRGGYQAENASVVLEVADILRRKGITIPDKALRDGLLNTHWMARYEFITPDIVIDGGHNIDGVRALCESLKRENRDITLCLAMMSDKDYEECIKALASIAKNVIATEVNMPRSAKAHDIYKICIKNNVNCIEKPDIREAIEAGMELSRGGLLCICGSLYLAGNSRKILRELLPYEES